MHRKTLAGAALLVVLVGCRDGPNAALAVEPETPVKVQSSAQPDMLLTIQQMVDDPLVLELIAALGDQTVADGFDAVRNELDRQAVDGDKLALHNTLMTTLDQVAGDPEGADVVLRDVLRLVLDDAGMLLVADLEVAPKEVVESDREKHADRVKH
jgi:hypothetical protein